MRRLGMILCMCAALASCAPRGNDEYKSTLYVFGTLVEIIVRGADRAQAQAATAQLSQEFQHMYKDWHAWKPGELSNLNKAFAKGETKKVSPFVLPLIVQAKRYYTMSDGLFNPAIGALVGAWGFHADVNPKGKLPPMARIRALAARHPTMDDVIIKGDRVHSRNPAVQLDFGGFAKGVAMDRAEKVLAAYGIKNAIVNAGGDLNTVGQYGGRPWRIAIRDPKAWGEIATVDLKPGEDVYTSGNYERYRDSKGVRYGHIINPRTGMPVRHIVSTTVIGYDGALADATATALTVAGPKGWYRIARRMGAHYVMLVDDTGTVYLNPAMKARVRFAKGLHPRIVQSAPL
ncbi:FAD:protein FMN transferase [Varunaivibrio sulfuroxidans]|uniref:FAD:protein FMN transferase n=1 Tax=Varunaivibrio sulfuroxidans TaxID=1773489 RepID=A0A4V2UNE4_9PROT|nr:FAD:protein FMN transferase [Varunaivibrio sulfuroxidans]TCS61761.1 thiamine biosynthesis lipoprotein [Varunaivibrio sulfuroxidans]WES32055.1 FAD:protein FMN transferase [Varunaivibrio sulfuroxidans]